MRKLLPFLAISLIAAGCVTAGGTSNPSAGQSATPAPTASGYDVATGPADLILRISLSGGLMAPGYVLTEVPWLALFGDGRIVVPGPVAEIYPGPLLPNLRVMRVTPAEIQKIVAAADAAGLLGPDASYQGLGIMDAGTTFFTTVVAGEVHRVSAYALMASVKGPDAASDAARARLLTFRDQIGDLATFLGRKVDDTEIFEPAGYRVFVHQAAEVPQSAPSPAPQVVVWPLPADPFKTGEQTTVPDTVCKLVTGSDLAAFLPVAKTANVATVWTFGQARYSISVRPLYPNENSCAGGSL